MDEILLHENENVRAVKKSYGNSESDFDDNELYQIYNMSHEYIEENLNGVSVRLNVN